MKTKSASFITSSLALPSLALTAPAQNVPQSGTNTINGRVRFVNADADIQARLGPPGDEGMTPFAIVANTEPPDAFQATKGIYNADRLSNPYEMTVTATDTPLSFPTRGRSARSLGTQIWRAKSNHRPTAILNCLAVPSSRLKDRPASSGSGDWLGVLGRRVT